MQTAPRGPRGRRRPMALVSICVDPAGRPAEKRAVCESRGCKHLSTVCNLVVTAGLLAASHHSSVSTLTVIGIARRSAVHRVLGVTMPRGVFAHILHNTDIRSSGFEDNIYCTHECMKHQSHDLWSVSVVCSLNPRSQRPCSAAQHPEGVFLWRHLSTGFSTAATGAAQRYVR